jgi:hypothetical protein
MKEDLFFTFFAMKQADKRPNTGAPARVTTMEFLSSLPTRPKSRSQSKKTQSFLASRPSSAGSRRQSSGSGDGHQGWDDIYTLSDDSEPSSPSTRNRQGRPPSLTDALRRRGLSGLRQLVFDLMLKKTKEAALDKKQLVKNTRALLRFVSG